MPDRRDEILNEELSKWVNIKSVSSIYPKKFPASYSTVVKNAMDVHWTERALELLEYIGEKCTDFNYDEFGQLQFQLKEGGHWVTKEGLFENFL